MPESKQSATAVFVSGGKQYRAAPGDRVLVGRLPADVGSELTLDRVLLHAEGDTVTVGSPAIEGLTITAKVLQHSRGPRVETLRYKSKKNVRVHKGGRADYTAIEILAIGGAKAAEEKPARRSRAKKPEEAESGS